MMHALQRSFALLLVLLVVAQGSAITPVQAADWPQFLGPERNGIAPQTEWQPKWPASGPKVAWTAQVGTGYGSMSVADGRFYTMGSIKGQETIHCLDAETGKSIWSKSYPAALINRLHQGGPSATPTIDTKAGRVYTVGKDGKVNSWDAMTGKNHWRFDMVQSLGVRVPQWGFSGSPLVLNDLLIIEAGPTVALNKNTGKIVWKSKAFTAAYSSPVAFERSGKTLIASLNSNGLVVHQASDGKQIAFAQWKTKYDTNATTPLVIGDRIYVSTGYGRGNALFRLQGNQLTKLWENTKLCNHMNNSVLIDGFLYGFDGNGHKGGPNANIFLTCLSLETGEELWRKKGMGCGSLLAAGDKLVILSDTGELITATASPRKFQPIAKAKLVGPKSRFTSRNPCWTMPILADGRIYVRDTVGKVVCVDARK